MKNLNTYSMNDVASQMARQSEDCKVAADTARFIGLTGHDGRAPLKVQLKV